MTSELSHQSTTKRLDLCLTVTCDPPEGVAIDDVNDDQAEAALVAWLKLCFPMLTEDSMDIAMCIDAFLDGIVIEDYAESFGIAGMIKRGEELNDDSTLLDDTGMHMSDFVAQGGNDDPDGWPVMKEINGKMVYVCDHDLPWEESCQQCNEEMGAKYGVEPIVHGTTSEATSTASDAPTSPVVNGVDVLRVRP